MCKVSDVISTVIETTLYSLTHTCSSLYTLFIRRRRYIYKKALLFTKINHYEKPHKMHIRLDTAQFIEWRVSVMHTVTEI